MLSNSVVIQVSPHPVKDTVKKLQEIIKARGGTIFALIDHSEEAQRIGLSLADETLIIFGNPKVGTSLMQENPEIGLELPLKILIWRDSKGETQIGYINPLTFKDQYRIQKNQSILEKMAQALANLVHEAIT